MTTSASPWTRCGARPRRRRAQARGRADALLVCARSSARGKQPLRGRSRSARRPVAASPEGTLRGRPPRPPARRLPAGKTRSCRSDSMLARRLEDAEAVASSLIGLGLAAQGLGDHERAAAAFTEGAELARAGGYIWFLAVATGNLARARAGAGRLRAGEGSHRGRPRTLPRARRREKGRGKPRRSRHPRGSRGPARRGPGTPA